VQAAAYQDLIATEKASGKVIFYQAAASITEIKFINQQCYR
jgi:hypothetical protein